VRKYTLPSAYEGTLPMLIT